MSIETRHTLHPMFEQPSGWLAHSLPRFNEYSRYDPENFLTQEQQLFQAQENRWIDEVGLTPAETRATIVMPVHNEIRSLPSALGALIMSDVPSSANLQFIFIINGCSDDNASRYIIEDFLDNLAATDPNPETTSLEDDSISYRRTVRVNNLEFTLLETPEASKTKALNIGNSHAIQHESRVTINVDANNWLEPDALRSMIGTANKAISEDEAVVFGSNSMIAFRPSVLASVLSRLEKIGGKIGTGTSDVLHGWFMAWDTAWFAEMGGFPDVMCDDYTLSLLSRKAGKEVRYDSDARVWGYYPNNIRDKMESYTRFALQKIQIKDVFKDEPEIIEMLESDEPYIDL